MADKTKTDDDKFAWKPDDVIVNPPGELPDGLLHYDPKTGEGS